MNKKNSPVDNELSQPVSADHFDLTTTMNNDGSAHEGESSDQSWNEDENDTAYAPKLCTDWI